MRWREKYINLLVEMARSGVEWKDLEHATGKSRTSIYYKRLGTVEWNLEEMMAIQKFLKEKTGKEFPLDYLFKAEF